MGVGRALGFVSIFHTTLEFIQHVIQQCVVCQLQKLKKPDNTALALQRTCVFSQTSIVSKAALTFVLHKSHIWLNSNFCFLFTHQKLVLSAKQRTQNFSHLKILSLYINALILNAVVTENRM
jgi:hypothetical protein